MEGEHSGMTPSGAETSGIDPLVTIVLPTFNRADMLMEAVESIIAQTYRRWELLVVDDGSTDATIERVERLADSRIKLVRLAHSGNISRVRNAGVAAATGEYLAFLDSDDLWLPRRLETQLRALQSSQASWCYANIRHIDRAGAPVPFRAGRFRALSGRIAAQLLNDQTGAFIVTWLVRRRLFDEVGGFDEGLLTHGDLDLALRLSEAADVVAVSEVLALIRDHPSRTTLTRAHPHESAAMIFKKALDRCRDPACARLARRRWANHLASAACDRLASGDIAKGGGLLWRSLIHGASPPHWLRSLATGSLRLLGQHR
ncbi:MAG TPA: glycosyltransferase [Sphingomicrobium sp.]|nr:glycosyltransferase [Sphingomicrobium sp.]